MNILENGKQADANLVNIAWNLSLTKTKGKIWHVYGNHDDVIDDKNHNQKI